MTESVHGLEPVNTVFGPFLRYPGEGLAREAREAIESGTWCDAHGRIEPGPHYLACLECGHGFPTPEALVADHAVRIAWLNAELRPDGQIVAETDPEKITVCPHCAHDL
ncbi:hypothetical protein [Nonomuraea sp. NPDC049750]|uniref:hypothetical protein n=1 Tax=Nonomuraea sp. NPDC049750 TaxID=3154738 RepID=UPI0033F16F1B